MTELDIDVSLGPVQAIAVPAPVTGSIPLSGVARLYGWSFREAGFEVGSDIEGSIVAPAAGATVATTPSLAGGQYSVAWEVELTGAAAAADANNFALFFGATQIGAAVNPGVAGVYPQEPANVNNQFGQAISVKAIGAGTAGVTYAASISALPQTGTQSVMEISDGNQALGEVSTAFGSVDTKWFGPMGVKVRNELRITMVSGLMAGVVYASYYRELR